MKFSNYRSSHNQCENADHFFNLLVYHIDEDRLNNRYENFKVLWASSHAIVHKRIKNINKMRYLYYTDFNQLTFSFFN